MSPPSTRPATTEPVHAILFDMDGTIIECDMEEFLPQYFKAISPCFGHLVAAGDLVKHLITSTQVTIVDDTSRSNRQVFESTFSRLMGYPWRVLEPIFDAFYAKQYLELYPYVREKPGAQSVVQTAFDLGCKVVVATNPLYPDNAIRQRLVWGGVDDYPYDLITSIDNSSACKPNPRYFEEILAKIDCSPEGALVVGDTLNDMVAAEIGCQTFWIADGAGDIEQEPVADYRGSLEDVEEILHALSCVGPTLTPLGED